MSERSTDVELPSWMADHIKLYLEDPEQAHMWDSTSVGGPGVLPTLLLTTTGRRSGKPRVLPLLYQRTGDDFIVIASKGGAPNDPAWYLNLLENPSCEIRVGREHHRVMARTSKGEERATLWKKMTELYAPFDDYQAATEREIPVVVLEPTN